MLPDPPLPGPAQPDPPQPGPALLGPAPKDLAALHARCFTAPPPWSAAAFVEALAAPGAFLLGDARAFLLGRVIAGEGEVMILAVAPEARRGGLGRALVARFAAAAQARGATECFLEVAADNAPARGLYAGLGWVEAGRRPRYYGTGRDALILRLALAQGQDSG